MIDPSADTGTGTGTRTDAETGTGTSPGTVPALTRAPDTPPAVGSNRWYLSSAPILRSLIHLCIPMAAAMIVSALYNVVNAGFLGSLHDSALLAAITLGTPMLALVMAVGGIFGVGGGALISRKLGEGERDPAAAQGIKHVSAFSFWGAVISGALVATAGLLFLDPLVALLGADAATAPATREYATVMLIFVPVLAAAFCLEQLVRAEGAAKQVMIGLIAATAMNVLFDIVFILVLPWGVAGAALSMGLANLILVGYFATWLHRNSAHVRLAPRWFTLSPEVLRPVFGIGVGELLQAAFMILTTLVLNNLAAGHGEQALAAMGIGVRIAQVPEFLVMGITIGVLPLLAYTYGKGDRARLSAALRASGISVAAVVVLFSAVVFLFREPLLGLFTADPAVLLIGVTVLTAQLVATLANGCTGLLKSLFQAAGRVTPTIVLSIVQGVLFLPIVFVGNLWFGLAGIIWALTISEALVLVAALVLWLLARAGIQRGLAEGSEERAEAVLAEQD
ncbi:putative MATE family efflux protein [Leucobacter luti]|uniref:MATE family efflux transporter n=1 Tax=Leucobacter luti TaxID=340320 RepID=UPI0010466B5E|nr:MATE family efflux transporter [Leucobacter luti]MCW2288943.1 putative MATE family efflux protein [Leucobacter luti]TCK44907.1 putative MATE family efflux protein [Leucobacter luti]